MTKARMEIELAVRTGKHPGNLSKILSIVADRGVNILAYCTYFDRDHFKILLVTEAAPPAKHALEEAGYDCVAESVVMVGAPDRVGAAAELGRHLSRAGIDIMYSYASTSRPAEFFAIFNTSDNERAVRVLEQFELTRAA